VTVEQDGRLEGQAGRRRTAAKAEVPVAREVVPAATGAAATSSANARAAMALITRVVEAILVDGR
jgi:hypothetical protein